MVTDGEMVAAIERRRECYRLMGEGPLHDMPLGELSAEDRAYADALSREREDLRKLLVRGLRQRQGAFEGGGYALALSADGETPIVRMDWGRRREYTAASGREFGQLRRYWSGKLATRVEE